VKAVVLPTGGQSYNPSVKDHKNLLKKVSEKEEEQVQKNLKNLKSLHPLTYAGEGEEIVVAPKNEDSESYVDSSEEEIDMDAPLAVNEPIDRLNIKTQADRNKEIAKKAKLQLMKDQQAKRKFDKDIERIESLVKHS